jgi:hypothetical protein
MPVGLCATTVHASIACAGQPLSEFSSAHSLDGGM